MKCKVEHLWNDTDRVKQVQGTGLLQCHCFTAVRTGSGVELSPGIGGDRPNEDSLEPWHGAIGQYRLAGCVLWLS
jgi:hypothetical protein